MSPKHSAEKTAPDLAGAGGAESPAGGGHSPRQGTVAALRGRNLRGRRAGVDKLFANAPPSAHAVRFSGPRTGTLGHRGWLGTQGGPASLAGPAGRRSAL